MSVEISNKFPSSKIVSNDIAKEMIVVAKKRNIQNVKFFVRGEEPEKKYDLVLYMGVYNAMNIQDEMKYVSDHLEKNGIFIVSLTHKNAFTHLLKPSKLDAQHLKSIRQYNDDFKKYFKIEKVLAHSVFVPHLWKLPFARYLQVFVDKVFGAFFCSPMHEQIYILSNKNNL